jgi:hypothetical protein
MKDLYLQTVQSRSQIPKKEYKIRGFNSKHTILNKVKAADDRHIIKGISQQQVQQSIGELYCHNLTHFSADVHEICASN